MKRLNPPPRAEWQPTRRLRDVDPESACCAKCRRGTKGFGLRPCGYDLKCPNHCHDPKEQK